MRMNRRSFLAGSGAAAWPRGALAQSRAPTNEELKRAAAAPVIRLDGLAEPLVIESIELLKGEQDHFVHVRAKGGAEGIAVANRPRPNYLHPIFNQLIAPFLIGKDARDWERLMWELYRAQSNYKLQGLAFWSPHAWAECAILDLLGRVAGKSIGELLGGVIRKEIAVYVASGRRDSTPEEEVEYLRRLLDETGAKAVKFRVGGRMSRNADAMPGRTEKLIPLARKALGDDIAIHADSNSSYDPPQAIRVGRMLEEINAVYFEEPCEFDDLWATKEVADALTIPVAGGEQESSEHRFRWMIANRGVDIVQPDLLYHGGLVRSMRVARMAALAHMPATVHISGGFGFIYMLHFASVVRDIGPYQEYKREIERFAGWFDPPIKVVNAKITVPAGPGVGIKDIAAVIRGATRVA